MSTDFKKVLLKDSRLMVTDSVNYAVVKGGSNMTCAQFNAIGGPSFSSTINFNIAVPSQETIISRNALIRVTLNYQIVGATKNVVTPGLNGQGFLWHYGGVDSLGPFPFHQMINSQQWTVNNTTVSQVTRDILAMMMRIHDKRWLARFNGMTPTLFDTYASQGTVASLASGATTIFNPSSGSFQAMSVDNDIITRGAHPLDYITCSTTNYLANGTAVAPRTVLFGITVTEPVMISPFVFAGDDSPGFYGIQNLVAIFNLDTTCNTAIRFGGNPADRWINAASYPVVSFVGATTPQLLLEFLTPHPSDLMPSRNVLGNYYELPRYLTPCQAMASGAIVSLATQSLQLNSVPDKLYICVSKPVGSRRSVVDSDSFLPIQGITIQWNNSAGILSSATQQDLFHMSVSNGINMNWLEWRGLAQGTPDLAQGGAVQGLPQIATVGSVLCLEFGKDIELKQDYYAPGSIGQFNLQFTLSFQNNTGAALNSGDYQIVTMIQNSGIFSLERGVCSQYLGILTKSDVLEASRQQPHSYPDALRMVGGGETPSIFKRMAGVLGKVAHSEAKGMSAGGETGGKHKGKRTKDYGALEDRLM
jgi:hypothetical protein